MTITHQDILDRRKSLRVEHGVAYKKERDRIAAEQASLQEVCAGIGHLWGESSFIGLGDHRVCAVCGVGE